MSVCQKNNEWPNVKRGAGFSILEILVAVVILSILMALSASVYGMVVRKGHDTATHAVIERLGQALINYKQSRTTFPIIPGENMDITTDKIPGYFTMTCAPLGTRANGKESNKALIAFLIKHAQFKVESRYLRDGELLDDYGHPIIVRFLRKREMQNDPDSAFDECVYIFSYGADGKNQTNASSAYIYQSAPKFDADEMHNIEASKGGSDDIRMNFR